MASDLIDSTEMYLRTVLELEEEGIPALRARLAERLDISPPSVSEGVARLVEEGLVEIGGDRTVALTTPGRELATHVLRKHRLAERLLVDVLGLEDEHVHEEACRWEHVISDRVEQRLLEFLGHPTTSPYGNPIPGVDGGSHGVVVPLPEASEQAVVARISEKLQGEHAVMSALADAGVAAGVTVHVDVRPDAVVLTGPHGDLVELSPDDARLLYVRR